MANFVKLLYNEYLKNKNLGKGKWGVPVFAIAEDINENFWVSAKNKKQDQVNHENHFNTHAEHLLLKDENIINNNNKLHLYITTQPCEVCTTKITNKKNIKKVIYLFDNKNIKDSNYLNTLKIEKYKTNSEKETEIIKILEKEFIDHQKRGKKRHNKKY